MALNKTIVKKVREKTDNRQNVGDFIVKLLEFQSEKPGWWKEKYNTILDSACKDVNKNENY